MTKYEKEMHEKLVKSNVSLEKELSNVKMMYNKALGEINKEQGKSEALSGVVKLLSDLVAGRSNYD